MNRLQRWMCAPALALVGTAGLAQTWESELSPALLEVQTLIGRAPDAALPRLEALAPAADAAPRDRALHLLMLAQVYDSLVYPEKAIAAAEEGLALVSEATDGWLHQRLAVVRSFALSSAGQASQAIAPASAAIAWAEREGNTELLIDALGARGFAYNELLDHVAALADLLRAYGLAPERGPGTVRAHIASYLALIYEYRGEPELAIPYFEEAVAYFTATDNPFELSIALFGLGRANIDLEHFDAGRRQLERSLELAREIGDEQGAAYALRELSDDDLRRGDLAAAEARLLEAERIFQPTGNRAQLIGLYRDLMQLALKRDDLQRAAEYLDRAESFVDFEALPSQSWGVRVQRAALLRAEGRAAEAYDQLTEARDALERLRGEETTRQLNELRARFELDAAERQNALLARENELQRARLEAEIQRGLVSRLGAAFASTVALLLGVLVWRAAHHRRRLQEMADIDSLTGLFRRRKALELLEAALAEVDRRQGDLAVALLDLDHFKAINDTFGHPTGDRVLEAVGGLLAETLTRPAFAGRVGGEEFLVALPDTSLDAAHARLDALRPAVASLGPACGITSRRLSLSGGVARYEPGMGVTRLVAMIDELLYEAKRSGRDRVLVGPGSAPAPTRPPDLRPA